MKKTSATYKVLSIISCLAFMFYCILSTRHYEWFDRSVMIFRIIVAALFVALYTMMYLDAKRSGIRRDIIATLVSLIGLSLMFIITLVQM